MSVRSAPTIVLCTALFVPLILSACNGSESPPPSVGSFGTGGTSSLGSGGSIIGLPSSSGGNTFVIGDDDYVLSDDYGLSGQGGAAANGLGLGDLTVLLLIDRSSSMAESWDSGSKWEVSLNAFFLGLVGVEEEITLGAIFFPTDGECGVAPMTAPGQFKYQSGARFVSSWKAKSSGIFPEGSTPLGPAFEQANTAILEANEAGLLAQRRFRVVVVTDGTPNCNTDQNRVLSLASTWRGWGVEVRVIGLPGSEEAATFLSQLANPAVNQDPDTDGSDDLFTPDSGEDAEGEFSVILR